MKTIKISDEAWQGLMQLKIEYKKRSIDEVVKALLKERKDA
jgi:predicted CopG family antitoxin